MDLVLSNIKDTCLVLLHRKKASQFF